MNDKYDIIKNLTKNFDYDNINLDILNHNCEILVDYYNRLKRIYEMPIDYIITECDPRSIKKVVMKTFLYNNNVVANYINDVNICIKLKFNNVEFYYVGVNNYESDLKLIFKLFKITVIMVIFSNCKENIKVIWVPVKRKRNFNFDNIDETSLNRVQEEFQAFSASGLSFNHISIITRYEEIEKLLLHELIHNLNLDGSEYHSYFKDIIKDYNTHNNYKYEYSIYESYTELLSSYLNILFRLMEEDPKNLMDRIKACVIIEYIYSCNVVSNLLLINNYSSYQDFIDNGCYLYGNISLYEYYYLKTIMYNNFKLLNLVSKNDFRKNLTNILRMDKIDRNIDLSRNIKDYNFRYVYFV